MAVEGSETVEVWRSPGKDRYGDPVEDQRVAVLKRCVSLPRSSTEVQDARLGYYTIPGFQIYVPPQKVAWEIPSSWPAVAREERVRSADVVLVRGQRLAVEGQPEPYLNKDGEDQGMFITTLGTSKKVA